MVTGAAAGTSTITYTVTTVCGTASTSADITVNPLPSAGSVSGPNAVCVNATISLGSDIAGGVWSSSAPAIASINSSGQVLGKLAGTAIISYTVSTTCGSNVATYTVTVNAVPSAGTVSGPSSVCVGSSISITNTGGAPGGLWKSLNTARATVNAATGEVTGVSAGLVTITYSVGNSCGTSVAAMSVTVKSHFLMQALSAARHQYV